MEPTSTSHGSGNPIAELSNDRDVPIVHRKGLSASIFSKFYFLKNSGDEQYASTENEVSTTDPVNDRMFPKITTRAMAAVVQQKSRRRKGSLRKTALLGRGAQREKKESKISTTEIKDGSAHSANDALSPVSLGKELPTRSVGLGISNYASSESLSAPVINKKPSSITTLPMGKPDQILTLRKGTTSPTLSYTSTTDEEDIIGLPIHSLPTHVGGPASDSYFPPDAISLARHRSVKMAKSPLSVAGLASSSLPAPTGEWDYSETEWWGWVLLFITWIVFVTGMGSCFGVWSWAWDVGETPYAPPELEDDPTLPIVGYYPALIILTSVMAWVWVIVAWVGMKYFRHTKISGD
ncbi:hypothetical protein K3495_g4964 [Podosphaera aphanis]|nr:hypothetical protein K3495_g4964 [Podosphaera aphanis]